MSKSYVTLIITLITLIGLSFQLAVVSADGAASQSTREEVLAHAEVQGALAAIDAWLEGNRVYDKVPGISAGVVYDQDLIWDSGYGYSNVEAKRSADADTIYSVCSISKLFTSISVMQLRDAGKLRLRDPVSDYLDWFDIEQVHDDSGPITIESMLTHSSGMPREAGVPYWTGPDFPFPTREQMIARLQNQRTLYPAQDRFQYSNLAMSVAGEIVREESGEEFAVYVKLNILDPLSMNDTRAYYPEELRGEQLAIGYSGMERSGTRVPVDPFFTRAITAAAGMTSTVNDLAKFASWQFRLLRNGGKEVLDKFTLREMHRVHWLDPDWETTWGIGFRVWEVDGVTTIGHDGGCPGYITDLRMIPKEKVASIVLTNAGDSEATRLSANVLKVITAALKEPEAPSGKQMPDFSKYEGNYGGWPWGGETAIRQWGDQLVGIRIPSRDLGDAMTMYKHVEGNTFVRLDDDDQEWETIVFEIGGDGKAQRITRHDQYSTRIERK